MNVVYRCQDCHVNHTLHVDSNYMTLVRGPLGTELWAVCPQCWETTRTLLVHPAGVALFEEVLPLTDVTALDDELRSLT